MTKKYLILTEALISAGLIVYFSFAFLLMVFLAGIVAVFSPRPLDALYILAVLSIAYTLGQYLLLAFYTALNKKYKFGILFWLGIPGILVSIYLVLLSQETFSLREILIAAPITFSLMHFIYLQIRGFKSI